MITITELIQSLKRHLDADLEAIIGKLIKKGIDSNTFISNEVRGAL